MMQVIEPLLPALVEEPLVDDVALRIDVGVMRVEHRDLGNRKIACRQLDPHDLVRIELRLDLLDGRRQGLWRRIKIRASRRDRELEILRFPKKQRARHAAHE